MHTDSPPAPPPPPPPYSLIYCQCVTPYVGNGMYCVLDRDGDSFPAVVSEMICKERNEISYCQQDVCPNVPNNPASDSTPCQGFDQSTGTFTSASSTRFMRIFGSKNFCRSWLCSQQYCIYVYT